MRVVKLGQTSISIFRLGMFNRSKIDMNCRALELCESNSRITIVEARP